MADEMFQKKEERKVIADLIVVILGLTWGTVAVRDLRRSKNMSRKAKAFNWVIAIACYSAVAVILHPWIMEAVR